MIAWVYILCIYSLMCWYWHFLIDSDLIFMLQLNYSHYHCDICDSNSTVFNIELVGELPMLHLKKLTEHDGSDDFQITYERSEQC